MSTRFHALELWSRIRLICTDAGPRSVANPFVSSGASRRLPLKRGDLLVTRCNRTTVKLGQTDPKEILAYIRKGVHVHNVDTLHAKVYVSAVRCLICSANVSKESEQRLVEAGLESTGRQLVSEARAFVHALRGEAIEEEFARALIKHYRPPRIAPGAALRRGRGKVRQSDLWVIGVRDAEYSEQEDRVSEAGEREATKRGANPRMERLESIDLPARGKVPSFGERVLQINNQERSRPVTRPARIMSSRRYQTRNGARRVMLTVAVPKGTRTVPLRTVIKKLGSKSKALRHMLQRKLDDTELAAGIAQLWPD